MMLFVSLLFFAITTLRWTPTIGDSDLGTPDKPMHDSKVIFALVNRWRRENNLGEYKENDALCSFAQKRAQEAYLDNSHAGFDTSEQYKYLTYYHMAENLSYGYNTDEEVFAGWLNSPTHKATLQDSFTDSCISCYMHVCAQEFGEMKK